LYQLEHEGRDKLDLGGLTDNEVKELLQSLKRCTRQIPEDMPLIGRIKDDTPVVDFKNHIEYFLHRYRNPFDSKRFSLHIRFQQTNDHLIRIDIHNGTHRNPDGTLIPENHMHVYHFVKGLRKDVIAIPLPAEIHNITSLFAALEDFLAYTNVTEYPK
jgi:hypothetical protein